MNVWAGTVGGCLVSLHVLSYWLTGNHCWDFILYDMPKLLQDVSLAVREQMWFIPGCALTHFSHAERDVQRMQQCVIMCWDMHCISWGTYYKCTLLVVTKILLNTYWYGHFYNVLVCGTCVQSLSTSFSYILYITSSCITRISHSWCSEV
jgi:hypothetical protein